MISQKELGKKIKELREGMNLSQYDLAKQVGLSRVAFSQIECGNRGMEALELAKIAGFFGVSMNEILKDEQPAEFNKKIVNSVVGNKFNAEKLRNVILYILEKCGGKPNIGETVLYKLLYFIDFDSFEKYGRSVTGMNYVRLQYGPVPTTKEYTPVIKSMVVNNELKIFTQEYFGRVQKRYVALVNHADNSLTASETTVIDMVVSRLSDMSATQIEGYAHGDIPWKVTADKQVIEYDLVIDREMPYAQVDHEKMWQEAVGADVIKRLGPISKEEHDYYMSL
jgi:transcriptional regulator with XRE-family HTH domain